MNWLTPEQASAWSRQLGFARPRRIIVFFAFRFFIQITQRARSHTISRSLSLGVATKINVFCAQTSSRPLSLSRFDKNIELEIVSMLVTCTSTLYRHNNHRVA